MSRTGSLQAAFPMVVIATTSCRNSSFTASTSQVRFTRTRQVSADCRRDARKKEGSGKQKKQAEECEKRGNERRGER